MHLLKCSVVHSRESERENTRYRVCSLSLNYIPCKINSLSLSLSPLSPQNPHVKIKLLTEQSVLSHASNVGSGREFFILNCGCTSVCKLKKKKKKSIAYYLILCPKCGWSSKWNTPLKTCYRLVGHGGFNTISAQQLNHRNVKNAGQWYLQISSG